MTGSNKLGFFGKIPSNGDFVSRQLPRTFVEPWDQWLQESIATSREQLGQHWLNTYLIGPIWRFALSRGVCGDNAWIGLVMPSVDRVGRYFPLTLAVPVNNSCKLLNIADNEEPWFSQAEHIALSALDQNNNLEAFNQDIENLAVPSHLSVISSTPPDEKPGASLASNKNWRIAMLESVPVTSNLSPLMEQFIQQRFPDFTLWWTSGSELVEPSILICNKLPPAQGFSALLTGNWDHWGWDNIITSTPSIPQVKDKDEHIDSEEDVTESVAESVAEGETEEVAESVTEGAAEGVTEGAAEGVTEGVTEGAAESVDEGLDVNKDIDEGVDKDEGEDKNITVKMS